MVKHFRSVQSSPDCGATGECLLTWGLLLSLVTSRKQETAEVDKTKRSQQTPIDLVGMSKILASVPNVQSQVDLLKSALKIL